MKLFLNSKKLIFSLLFMVVFTSFTTHKYYLSVYQVDFDKQKKEIQITARIFIDDFEKALKTKHKKPIYLTDKNEIKEANDLITDYFKEKILIKTNNKNLVLEWVTKEKDNEMIVCYLKARTSGKIKNLEINNTMLTEIFSTQQNLLHLNINDKKSTLLFTADDHIKKTNY